MSGEKAIMNEEPVFAIHTSPSVMDVYSSPEVERSPLLGRLEKYWTRSSDDSLDYEEHENRKNKIKKDVFDVFRKSHEFEDEQAELEQAAIASFRTSEDYHFEMIEVRNRGIDDYIHEPI